MTTNTLCSKTEFTVLCTHNFTLSQLPLPSLQQSFIALTNTCSKNVSDRRCLCLTSKVSAHLDKESVALDAKLQHDAGQKVYGMVQFIFLSFLFYPPELPVTDSVLILRNSVILMSYFPGQQLLCRLFSLAFISVAVYL